MTAAGLSSPQIGESSGVSSATGMGRLREWWSGVQPSSLIAAQNNILRDTPAATSPLRLYGRPGARLNTVDLPGPAGSEEHPPFVLLHGLGTGLGIWARQLKELSDDNRVIAVDLPGMGGSERAPFYGKTEEEAEDFFLDAIEEWRNALGLAQMVLVGHSLGGFLAAAYALKYPQFVAHLVLVSPQGLASVDHAHDTTAAPSMAVLWSRGITPQRLCRWGGRFLGPGIVDSFVGSRFEGEALAWRKSLAQYLYSAWAAVSDAERAATALLPLTAHPHQPLQERLRKLRVGVVFVYGHYDWEDYRAADELIPRLSVSGSVALIANAGHYPFIDNAPKFNALLQRLLFVTRARHNGVQIGLHPVEPTPPGSGSVSARSVGSREKAEEQEGAAPAPQVTWNHVAAATGGEEHEGELYLL